MQIFFKYWLIVSVRPISFSPNRNGQSSLTWLSLLSTLHRTIPWPEEGTEKKKEENDESWREIYARVDLPIGFRWTRISRWPGVKCLFLVSGVFCYRHKDKWRDLHLFYGGYVLLKYNDLLLFPSPLLSVRLIKEEFKRRKGEEEIREIWTI